MKFYFPDEPDLLEFAWHLYEMLVPGDLIFLHGPLGAGKTSLVRGCLQAAGHTGKVKSPTYTLVEEYRLSGRLIYHFDLYRLSEPGELEAMGIRDYLTPEAICFIEWAERGTEVLPAPDFELALSLALPGRVLELFDKRGSLRNGAESLGKLAARLAQRGTEG